MRPEFTEDEKRLIGTFHDQSIPHPVADRSTKAPTSPAGGSRDRPHCCAPSTRAPRPRPTSQGLQPAHAPPYHAPRMRRAILFPKESDVLNFDVFVVQCSDAIAHRGPGRLPSDGGPVAFKIVNRTQGSNVRDGRRGPCRSIVTRDVEDQICVQCNRIEVIDPCDDFHAARNGCRRECLRSNGQVVRIGCRYLELEFRDPSRGEGSFGGNNLPISVAMIRYGGGGTKVTKSSPPANVPAPYDVQVVASFEP